MDDVLVESIEGEGTKVRMSKKIKVDEWKC
jgi:hypothetical protein